MNSEAEIYVNKLPQALKGEDIFFTKTEFEIFLSLAHRFICSVTVKYIIYSSTNQVNNQNDNHKTIGKPFIQAYYMLPPTIQKNRPTIGTQGVCYLQTSPQAYNILPLLFIKVHHFFKTVILGERIHLRKRGSIYSQQRQITEFKDRRQSNALKGIYIPESSILMTSRTKVQKHLKFQTLLKQVKALSLGLLIPKVFINYFLSVKKF